MATKKGDPRLSRKYREVRKVVLARDEWTCHYCQQPATTVDHIIPIKKGGDPIAIDNMVACCVSCNSAKGSRSQGLFLQSKRTPPLALSLQCGRFQPKTHRLRSNQTRTVMTDGGSNQEAHGENDP